MRCRDCPYGIEDFTLRTEMYKSVYGEYPDEDRANQSEQFVWCDKVGGKVYSFGHCSDWYEQDEENYKNYSKKKRINKRERYLKHQNHLRYLYEMLVVMIQRLLDMWMKYGLRVSAILKIQSHIIRDCIVVRKVNI